MKRVLWILASVLFLAAPLHVARAQEAALVKEGVEQVMEAIGKSAAENAGEQLAKVGGEGVIRELVIKAEEEGGRDLLNKIVSLVDGYGPTVIKMIERSPKVMVSAFEDLAPEFRQAALRAAFDSPELATDLATQFGSKGLELAAKYPGVAEKVGTKLGIEGIETANGLTEDQAIVLARRTPQIAELPPPQRFELLEKIRQAPAKTLDFMEAHRTVTITAASLAAFISAKESLIGTADKPGLIERETNQVGHAMAPWIKATLGLAVAFLGAVALMIAWHVWQRMKMKRLLLLAKSSREDSQEKEE